jgi:hypothetical protein
MKKRLKNWITTIIGITMMVIGIGMIVCNYFFSMEIPILEIVMVMILGWTFLFAKDTLLEGLFLSIFKVKDKDV